MLRYTIRGGVVHDVTRLLEDVRTLVAEQKAADAAAEIETQARA
jgi:hypothetical protein